MIKQHTNNNGDSKIPIIQEVIQWILIGCGLFVSYVFFKIFNGLKIFSSIKNKSGINIIKFFYNIPNSDINTIIRLTLILSLLFLSIIIVLSIFRSITFLKDILSINFEDNDDLEEKIKEKANKIHKLIFSCAFQYMSSKYKVSLTIATLVGFFLLYKNFSMAIGFIIGVVFSCIAAFFNMYLSTNANLRVAITANQSMKVAFDTSFRAGLSGSLFTLSCSIICLLITMILTVLYGYNIDSVCFGVALGCSLICIFGRLAGGIFTKAADVGADLVGKIESALKEDDIKNPAVVADNIGDNVGDSVGMILDVFQSYEVTIIISFLCCYHSNTFTINEISYLMVNCIFLLTISFFTTYFGKIFMNLSQNVWNKLQLYCYGSIIMNMILSVGTFLGTYKMFAVSMDKAISSILCIVIGFIVSIFTLKVTEYYTSSKYSPVRKLAQSATSGHGTNIIYGMSIYYLCVAAPLIVIVIGVICSYSLLGIIGIMLSAISMISITGPVVTLDLIGPITDNGGGIAEMSGMSEETRDNTDHLDAVGNITKAMTKGFSIGAAIFTSIATNIFFVQEVFDLKKINIVCSIINPYIFIGLIIGGIITSIFCGLAMRSVGDAAKEIVLNIREQFQKNPAILEGTEEPDYMYTIDYLTKVSIRKMILPALLPIIVPISSFYIYRYFIGNYLIYDFLLSISMGNTLFGIFTSISMTTTGGAWDNSKKYIEEGHFGGKGSEAHKCAVTGDTVGDPLKDTAGPAINVLIKVMSIIICIFVILYK